MRIRAAQTYIKLGILNLVRVVLYRLNVKLGLYRVLHPCREIELVDGHLFGQRRESNRASEIVGYFGNFQFTLQSPPCWFENPFNKISIQDTSKHWSQFNDFGNQIGDIKCIWEMSRFNFIPEWAWAERDKKSSKNLPLNSWVTDWCAKNPLNQGVNWKCGQEVSIRALNLVLTHWITCEQDICSKDLNSILTAHLKRIRYTLPYAIGQNNNHGITEAVALYCVGLFLSNQQVAENPLALKCQKQGRALLENRVSKLILNDGTFSQYSTNYHRMVLDSLSMAECTRRLYGDQEFSDRFYKKVSLASNWLLQFVNAKSGRAPNLGANDGTLLFNFIKSDYQDFRPSVQLSQLIFENSSVYSNIRHGLAELFAEQIRTPKLKNKIDANCNFPDGGFCKLVSESSALFCRTPKFRFRPSHADALHVDLWCEAENLLIDGGTYSYNTSTEDQNYFSGTESHNTVMFDSRDQMPRLGRFLFGSWLVADSYFYSASKTNMLCSYVDSFGCRHQRNIKLVGKKWVIKDSVSGFSEKAVLRWRLKNVPWEINGDQVRSAFGTISISGEMQYSISLVDAQESSHYMKKSSVPSVCIVIESEGTLETVLEFAIPRKSTAQM